MPRVVKELATLRWLETSAVDHSANEVEGWAVMKATIKPGDEATALLEAEQLIVERQEALAKALDNSEDFLVDATNEVKEAVKTLSLHLDDQGASADDSQSAVAKAAKLIMDSVRSLMNKRSEDNVDMDAVLKRLGDAWPTFVKGVAVIVKSDGNVEEKQEALDKALLDLQTAVLAE